MQEAGVIYFIRNTRSGHVKVGYSANLAARIEALSCGSSDPLHLEGTRPGSHSDESDLHRMLKARGVHVRGEWFTLTDGDIKALLACEIDREKPLPSSPLTPTKPPTQPVTLLRTDEVARRLGISVSWLEKLRIYGGGPPFLKLGARAVAYRVDDLAEWIELRHRVRSTSEAP